MKRFTILITAFFLLSLPILFLVNQEEVHSVSSETLTKVRQRNLSVTVKTIGTLHATNAHLISSQIKGLEAKIIYLAPDGYPVKKNDVLVRFDPTPFEDTIRELSTEVESLSAGLDASKQLSEWEKAEVEQQVTTAEYSLEVAELDLERLVKGEGPMNLAQHRDEKDKAELELKRHKDYLAELEKLKKQGYGNPAELSRARDNISVYEEKFTGASRRLESYQDYVLPAMTESAKAKVENSRLRLQQSRQAGVHKIAKAEAAYRQVQAKLQSAENALAQARRELEKTVLKAPYDGLLIHYETFRNGELRTAREGDRVIIEQPILYLPDISSLIVKTRVREIDLHKVAIGQEAIISVDAYPDADLKGKVSFIGALAEKKPGKKSGEKYFQVHVSIDSVDSRLRPGMSARTIIQSADMQQVLALPIQAVFQDSVGAYCYIEKQGSLELQRIELGGSNEDFVEIVAGLAEGDIVSMVRPVDG